MNKRFFLRSLIQKTIIKDWISKVKSGDGCQISGFAEDPGSSTQTSQNRGEKVVLPVTLVSLP